MRSLRSLKSTHWVMWSSPLLLLVLVLTLTTSTPSKATDDTALSTTTTLATTRPTTVTTTTTTVRHRVAAPRRKNPTATTKISPTNTVASATSRLTVPTAPTTSGQRGADSSSVTDSSASSIASASAENVANGELSGQLSARVDVAVIPLEGPGTWTAAASAPINVTLNCQGAAIHVQTQFVIGAHQECQVTIGPASTTTSLTWQLLPTN